MSEHSWDRRCRDCWHWGWEGMGPFGQCCKVRGELVKSGPNPMNVKFIRDEERPEHYFSCNESVPVDAWPWPQTYECDGCEDFHRRPRKVEFVEMPRPPLLGRMLGRIMTSRLYERLAGRTDELR